MILLANVIKTTEITITRVAATCARDSIKWNVAVDGRPFGQIWTWKTGREVHPFHAKTLAGAYAAFATYEAAEIFIRGEI